MIYRTCTIGPKSTISRFGERFRDGHYSLISLLQLFAVLLLAVPPCPTICKSGGGARAPCAPRSRRHWRYHYIGEVITTSTSCTPSWHSAKMVSPTVAPDYVYAAFLLKLFRLWSDIGKPRPISVTIGKLLVLPVFDRHLEYYSHKIVHQHGFIIVTVGCKRNSVRSAVKCTDGDYKPIPYRQPDHNYKQLKWLSLL